VGGGGGGPLVAPSRLMREGQHGFRLQESPAEAVPARPVTCTPPAARQPACSCVCGCDPSASGGSSVESSVLRSLPITVRVLSLQWSPAG
jgi:hypothetical protein